jgi:hypothetical protein
VSEGVTQLDEDDVVESTAEDVTEVAATDDASVALDATADAGGELVQFVGSGQIIQAEKPADVLAKAGEIATALKDLIEKQNLAKKLGGKKPHVEVGGWQALGMLLGTLGGQPLHAETVWSRIACLPNGEPISRPYIAEVKRYHPNNGGLRETVTYEVDGYDWEAQVAIKLPSGGVVGRAEAMCSRTEEQWGKKPDPAVKSMAETRAESRGYRRAVGWIMHIAGYNPTPAEEMSPEQAAAAAEASDDLKAKAKAAIRFLCEHNAGKVAAKILAANDGKMPAAAATALVYVEAAQRASQPTPTDVLMKQGLGDAERRALIEALDQHGVGDGDLNDIFEWSASMTFDTYTTEMAFLAEAGTAQATADRIVAEAKAWKKTEAAAA